MSGVQYPAGEVHGVRRRRCVSTAFEFVLRQTPRMALGPTLQGLKRAAEAKKFERIAGRLAALAGAGQEATVKGTVSCGPGRRVRTALF